MHDLISSLKKHVDPMTTEGSSSATKKDVPAEHEADSTVPSSPKEAIESNVEPNLALIDLPKLMQDDKQHMAHYTQAWFEKLNIAVQEESKNPIGHGPKSDYEHVIRVVANAHRLWQAEKHHSWTFFLDPIVIYTAALVHDVGSSSCHGASQENNDADSGSMVSVETDEAKREGRRDVIRDFLDTHKCPPYIAGVASEIASYVSLAYEMNDAEGVKTFAENFPALKIVQDAVRLDALGHVGIARILAHDAISTALFIESASKSILDNMKTKTGRKEAEPKVKYMKEFAEKLQSDLDCNAILRGV